MAKKGRIFKMSVSPKIGICEICNHDVAEDLYKIEFTNDSYEACGWCFERIRQFFLSEKVGNAINVYYGCGKVCFGEMKIIGKFIQENNVKSVLEYGTGLSTEILAFFTDDLTTFDEFYKHHKMYTKLKHLNWVKFYWYQSLDLSKPIEPVLDRSFDFVFLDGGQARKREWIHAMKHNPKWVYLHDPHMGEEINMDEWECIWNERLWKRK
jgi:hypothetical protein